MVSALTFVQKTPFHIVCSMISKHSWTFGTYCGLDCSTQDVRTFEMYADANAFIHGQALTSAVVLTWLAQVITSLPPPDMGAELSYHHLDDRLDLLTKVKFGYLILFWVAGKCSTLGPTRSSGQSGSVDYR